MKPSILAWSLLSLIIPTLAISSDTAVEKRDDNPDADNTIFNGIEVPPQLSLTPESFEETIKDGYWFVKHYSPSCPHCRRVAPTWQTLYEFYYTSNPLSTASAKASDLQSSFNSFTSYYSFHFASMNCLAYMDKCQDLEIEFFPTFSLYHNGEVVEQFPGSKDMAGLSHFVEERLEQIRPGSRPRNGLKLPEPGATGVDTQAEPDKPEAKDKDPEAGIKAGEKHNEQVAQIADGKKTTESPQTATTSETAAVAPNHQGISVQLTAESFQKLVTKTRDLWFIKFFAPWCSHCQALAPNWMQMAKELKGVVNVGQVNCDAEPRLCKDAGVKGYPTIYFFRGGERVEYEGFRGLGDLINYSKKAVEVGSGVKYVDAGAFKELEETGEVIFLYFFDHATTSEDLLALERLTLNLIGRARLVKTDSAALTERFKISTWPRLLVVRDGRPSYYNALAPKDMRDNNQLLSWMQRVWLPIVPELTASNAREIMDGRFVVLGILTRRRSDEFNQAKRELKNAALEWMDKQTHLFQLEKQELRDAKQLRIEEAEDRNDQRALRAAKTMHINIHEFDKKQVGFAWVDGEFWERWLRTTYGIDVKHGERVIINDEDNRQYWDTSSSGASIMPSRTSILETIPLIISNPPKLKSKSTVGRIESVFFHTRSFIKSHRLISLSVFALFFAVVIYVVRRRFLRRGSIGHGGILGNGSGGGFLRLDGKEGLLSGVGTGKVD